jgi:hypothetical protein
VGIPDRASWLLREQYPTGTARGWRRLGCMAMMIAPLVIIILMIVVTIVIEVL